MLVTFRPNSRLLRHLYQILESRQSLAKHQTLLGKRDRLVHGGAEAEELAELIKSATKTGCRLEVTKAAHGVGALLDTTMILFHSIVERRITAMDDVTAQRLADRTRVGVMAIGCHPFRHLPDRRQSLLEKPLSRLHIAEHRPEIALDLLASCKQEAHIQERRHSVLQILVLEALAHAARGEQKQAREALLEAVTSASREGYQRLFLDEGAVMETLLKTLAPDLREPTLASYVQALLHTFASTRTRPDAVPPITTISLTFEPLTPQEQCVLRLLAEGVSNQHIADQLVISLATARKHVSNILSKLAVENRTQAVVRAREYALL